MRRLLALILAAFLTTLSGCCWLVTDSIDGMPTPVCVWNYLGI